MNYLQKIKKHQEDENSEYMTQFRFHKKKCIEENKPKLQSV